MLSLAYVSPFFKIFLNFKSSPGAVVLAVAQKVATPFTLEVEMEKLLNDQISLEYEEFYFYEQLVSFLVV